MQSVPQKAINWPLYRLRIRVPRTMAMLEGELPLRPFQAIEVECSRSGARIPNVVYQTWVDNAFGRRHRQALAVFRRANPDHSFRFYDEAAIERYMAEHYSDHPIFEVFRQALFGPLKADIWRYCVLFREGGVYLDIGKSIGMPLRELIPDTASAVLAWERRGSSPFPPPEAARAILQHPDKVMINWALMFAPKHPLLRRVIDGIVAKYPTYRNRISADPKQDILNFTGPLHLTECLLAAAEAGELGDCHQAGIEFDDTADWGVAGAWVRYIGQPPYELARNRPIVG